MAYKNVRFPNAKRDLDHSKNCFDTPQTRAPAYRLAFADEAFLCREEMRGVRLMMEMEKPELILEDKGIVSTIVMFGGARIKDPEGTDASSSENENTMSRYYLEARRFAHLMTLKSLESEGREGVIVTGGGPGIMEAGNRGAEEAGGSSIALNIVLPFEQAPNQYCTPDLCFNFHYFATRKFHFLLRAKAVTVFPGGFGTLDELFETLTLIQTQKMERIPILLFGKAFWNEIINWDALAKAGTIAASDLDLIEYVETADEAIEALAKAETSS